MSRPSAGPWKLHTEDDGLYVDCDKPATKDDMRLAEAAPELLEACKAADWNSLDLPEYVCKKIRAAIEKATGEPCP